MFDTVIHDCTFGAVRMNYADLMAYNCTFRNINGGTLFMMTNSYASYMCSTFEHMYGEFLYGDGYYNSLYYVDCNMDEDMMDWLTAMQDDGCDWIIIN